MSKSVSGIIQVDPSLAIPVYKQIVQSIIRNIEDGTLAIDDVLPSVNQIAKDFSLARGSVFTAYNDLRASGIIDSIPGKGYYIASTETRQVKRVMLLLNTFSAYREQLYQSITGNLPKTFQVNVFFYENDFRSFENLLRHYTGYYNLFLIVPPLHEKVADVLSQLDAKSVFLLENGFRDLRKNYAGVFQNFEKDLFSILTAKETSLEKYSRLLLVAEKENHTKEIIAGFQKFARKTALATAWIPALTTSDIQKGDAYIVINDSDLVLLVGHCTKQGWQPGKDVGVLSYNETPLKSVIANGITTLSPNYDQMGKGIAEMLASRRQQSIENGYVLTDRGSF